LAQHFDHIFAVDVWMLGQFDLLDEVEIFLDKGEDLLDIKNFIALVLFVLAEG
jgi:hypothetical protein